MATVLVIEDDDQIVAVVRAALEDEGYQVLHALDGRQVSAALADRPDLILLDLALPGLDGAALARRIRADPDTAAIPLVVMSARYDLEGAVGDLPIDDQLAKPFELDDLYATVARWAGPS
jgi:DNA-binding response OmpR family regulator